MADKSDSEEKYAELLRECSEHEDENVRRVTDFIVRQGVQLEDALASAEKLQAKLAAIQEWAKGPGDKSMGIEPWAGYRAAQRDVERILASEDTSDGWVQCDRCNVWRAREIEKCSSSTCTEESDVERIEAAWRRLVEKGMTVGPGQWSDTEVEVFVVRMIEGGRPILANVSLIGALRGIGVWEDR